MTAFNPSCPRCGYDLSGLVATWRESCPMGALCSECGLEFDTGRVMSPKLMGPLWSYEHSHAPSGRRWWATSWVSLNPLRLCRELSVDHRVRVGRLLRFLSRWLIAIHVLVFAMTFVMDVVSGAGAVFMSNSARRWVPGSVPRMSNPDFWWGMLRCLAWPYQYAMSIPTGVSSAVRVPTAIIVVLVFAPLFLMPLWMLLLGTSLRQARVRKVHILRGVCFSVPAGMMCLLLAIVAVIGSVNLRSVLNVAPDGATAILLLLWLVYLTFWWFAFVRWYLRLRHAAAVAALNMVMTVLLIVTVLALRAARFI